jgi:hypothetical protein
MSGRLTLWGAGEFLRTNISRTTEPVPNFFIALCLSRPSPYVTGLELDEPTTASYARALLPNDAESWSSGDQPHMLMNEVDVTFITATEPWGRIPYWAICNADIEGYVYAVGALEGEEVIETDDQVVIEAGEIAIELGPFFTDEDF